MRGKDGGAPLPQSPLQGVHPGASEEVMPDNPTTTQGEKGGGWSAAERDGGRSAAVNILI